MSTPTMNGPVLRLTDHPLQRCGSWAVALLADRDHPAQVTAQDVERVAERVAAEVVVAATTDKDSAAYDWWKVLFALYPNSKPTHAQRERDPVKLLPEIKALFAADRADGRLQPCTFCEQSCQAVWAKSVMPLFDSQKALNNLPPGVPGWPVCRACRLTLWALPYGAWVTAGSATVLTCDDPTVERAFVTRNVLRAGKIRQLGFKGLPASAGPEAVTLRALREHADTSGAAATLWTFKNDNQEPWLRTSSTRKGVAPFLRAMLAEPDCRRGWQDLRRSMKRRDKAGQVVVDGETAVARTLFDRDGEQVDRLPLELWNRSRDPDKVTARTLLRWRALCRLYLEVMYEMDVERLEPVAELLTEWIQKESTRGRFNDYRRAAGSSYQLHKLLMSASARLYLDGRRPADITEMAPQLLTDGPQGWRLRAQLFFEVIAKLSAAGAPVDKPDEGEEIDDKAPALFSGGVSDEEEELSA
jgi:CRISPR-associated protein Cst1